MYGLGRITVLCILAACIVSLRAKPSELKLSIQQVLKSLAEDPGPTLVEETERLRPNIITKYDFMRSDRSSGIDIPQPILVSTGITIQEEKDNALKIKQKKSAGESRRGRNLSFRSPRAKIGFTGLEKKVASAPIIQGVRLRDDETDKIDHRNGRFINNVFVPNNPAAGSVPGSVRPLPEYKISVSLGDGGKQKHSFVKELQFNTRQSPRNSRSYEAQQNSHQLERGSRSLPFNFDFDSFYAGREEEQDYLDAMALESRTNEVFVDAPDYDISRSSSFSQDQYTFSPEGETSYQSIPDHAPGSTIIQADNQDFDIQEQTYQMCPGCPTFSIPIPIPRQSSQNQDVFDPFASGFDSGVEAEEGLIQGITKRIVNTITPAIEKAREWLAGNELTSNFIDTKEGPLQAFTDRLSTLPGEANLSPLMYATVAAVGLGVATILSTGLSAIGGRQFPSDVGATIDNRISEALDYNPNDVLCLPRLYCEKLKSSKFVIDEFITTKKLGVWLLDRVYAKEEIYDAGEEPLHNQCHLRECIYSLLS